jgi:hypothetical protein
MASTILHIKNMVCNRCIKVVADELTKLGYSIKSIGLLKDSGRVLIDNEKE